jgi:hypothetical protein
MTLVPHGPGGATHAAHATRAWGLGLAGPTRYPPRDGTLQLSGECNKGRKSGSIAGTTRDMQAPDGPGAVPEVTTYTPAL